MATFKSLLENYPWCLHKETREIFRIIGNVEESYVIITDEFQGSTSIILFSEFIKEFTLFDGLQEAKDFQ